MPPETLNGLLERAAEQPDAGLRFVDRHEEERWESWGAVRRGACAVAGGLQALGIAPGERVGLVFPTGPGFFHAFFGALLAGAVPAPLPPPLRLGRRDESDRRTARMVAAAGARAVLVDGAVERLLGPLLAAAAELGCRALASLPRAAPHPVAVAPSSLAVVQFSSGTTVEPKPVALSHRAVVAQARLLNAFWPETDGVRPSGVSWLPLYHDMGLIGCVVPAVERPGVLTLLPPELFVARPASWLRTLSRYRATVSAAPSFAYGLCVEKVRDAELAGVDLSAWRVALTGAETIAPAVLRAFERRFAPWGLSPRALTPAYGLAEAALAVTLSAPDRPFRAATFDRRRLAEEGWAERAGEGTELVSVGPPLPGFEIAVRDGAGRPLAERRVGRIWVRGPSLMSGYLHRDAATAEVLQEGWLDTGDLGFLDAGELYLTGRAKEVVIVRGRNHSPAELEQAVDALAGVRRGGAVAVSRRIDGESSERLLLVVEHARRSSPEEIATLPRRCAEAVLAAAGVRPDEVVVVGPAALPRTSSGKLRRGATLERYLSGRLAPAAAAGDQGGHRLGGG